MQYLYLYKYQYDKFMAASMSMRMNQSPYAQILVLMNIFMYRACTFSLFLAEKAETLRSGGVQVYSTRKRLIGLSRHAVLQAYKPLQLLGRFHVHNLVDTSVLAYRKICQYAQRSECGAQLAAMLQETMHNHTQLHFFEF